MALYMASDASNLTSSINLYLLRFLALQVHNNQPMTALLFKVKLEHYMIVLIYL